MTGRHWWGLLFQEQVGPGPDPHGRESFQVDKLKWCVCVCGGYVCVCGGCSWEIQFSLSPKAGPFTGAGSEPALPCSLNPRDRLNALISAPGWHRETQQLHPPPLSGATERCIGELIQFPQFSSDLDEAVYQPPNQHSGQVKATQNIGRLMKGPWGQKCLLLNPASVTD